MHFSKLIPIRCTIHKMQTQISLRNLSSASSFDSFQYDQLHVQQESPPTDHDDRVGGAQTPAFGHQFARHMLQVAWDADRGWGRPTIEPVVPFQLHPGAKVLHYAQTVFEGMKAYHDAHGHIRLFRPELNMQRFLLSSQRAALPSFDPHQLLLCLKQLIRIEKDAVPKQRDQSLYVRPTHIGIEPALGVNAAKQSLLYVILSPVGSYFASGKRTVSLYAQPDFVRAWPGGAGDRKMGANYAPTIRLQQQAHQAGCDQVLWLFGEQRLLTEVGTMNIFVLLRNNDGDAHAHDQPSKPILITPPLSDGLILPGITRDSVLQLARQWSDIEVQERSISMDEIEHKLAHNQVLEIFGTGTACVISPVDQILYQNQWLTVPTMNSPINLHHRLLTELNQIYYGDKTHEWSHLVC